MDAADEGTPNSVMSCWKSLMRHYAREMELWIIFLFPNQNRQLHEFCGAVPISAPSESQWKDKERVSNRGSEWRRSWTRKWTRMRPTDEIDTEVSVCLDSARSTSSSLLWLIDWYTIVFLTQVVIVVNYFCEYWFRSAQIISDVQTAQGRQNPIWVRQNNLWDNVWYGTKQNQSPKGTRSALPLPCFFDVVKSQ